MGQWETIYDLDRDFTHMSTTQKHPVGKLCASLGQEKRKYAADKWCQTDRQIDRQMVQKSAPADWGPNYNSVLGGFF